MRLAPLACIALSTSLLGCSGKTIDPNPDALAAYIEQKGKTGFLIQETGGRKVAVAFVRKPMLFYCSFGQDQKIPTADECYESPTYAGRLGHKTISGPDAQFHCLMSRLDIAINLTTQHAICVGSEEMDLVAKRPPVGAPVPMSASAGEPFYILQFISGRDNREVYFNMHELPAGSSVGGGEKVAEVPARAMTECERLAEREAFAEAAADRSPSAHTLRELALAQVEMIAAECPSDPGAARPAGNQTAARPASEPAARQPTPASSSVPIASGGFVEREMADISNGCNYSDRVRELYDAYGPTESWDDSGDGRWTISLASPNGGERLSPEFGPAIFTLHEDEGYTHLRVPVEGGTLYGLPVSELAWSRGLDNGINVFSVRFAVPLPAIKERMAERGIQLKAGEYDAELDISFGPELVRDEQTGASYLVCDEST